MSFKRARITAAGIYGAKGPIKVGTEFAFDGDLPKGWAGKCVVFEEASEEAEPVVNPAPAATDLEDLQTMNKDQLLAFAKDREIEVDGRWKDEKLREVLIGTVEAASATA